MKNRSIMPPRCAEWLRQYYVKIGNNSVKCVICDNEFTMLRTTLLATTNNIKKHVQQQHAVYLDSIKTKRICWEQRFYRKGDTKLQCTICTEVFYITTCINPRLKIHLHEHNLYENTTHERLKWIRAFFDGTICIFCRQIFKRSPVAYYIKHLVKDHRVVLPFGDKRIPRVPGVSVKPKCARWVRQYYVKIGKNRAKCGICNKELNMLIAQPLRTSNGFQEHIEDRHPAYLNSSIIKKTFWETRFYKKIADKFHCVLCQNFYRINASINPRLKYHLQLEHQLYKNTMVERIQWLNKYFNGTQCQLCKCSFRRSRSVYYIKHLLKTHQIVPFCEPTGKREKVIKKFKLKIQ
ncbi:uncharacterized protein LOC126853064 isoform X2 [Cataglyphis hispanica]|uniref:uncharacterized protein LOC126853064 isoform X2 n=1 Tax=Cataglyphis hispanica TaxID=1086592 RepID=UPI0021805D1C|nr:uncharacterized protein LOC126853064 isoform X2 [Cataglyphis hispanica]